MCGIFHCRARGNVANWRRALISYPHPHSPPCALICFLSFGRRSVQGRAEGTGKEEDEEEEEEAEGGGGGGRGGNC